MQDEDNNGKHTNKYDCKCKNCQIKFGSLALLVEGIEKKCAEEQLSNKTEIHLNRTQSSTSQTKPSFSCKSNDPTGYQKSRISFYQSKSTISYKQVTTSYEPSPSCTYQSTLTNSKSTTTNTSSSKYADLKKIKSAKQQTVEIENLHSTLYIESQQPSTSYQPKASTSSYGTSTIYQPSTSSYRPSSSKLSTTITNINPSGYYNRKEIKCSDCDKTFNHKGDFNKHVRTHTGEQPFACTMCDRRFSHTSNLIRHLRLHSGSKPFSCDICKKEFSRKDKLDLHQKGKSCRKQ